MFNKFTPLAKTVIAFLIVGVVGVGIKLITSSGAIKSLIPVSKVEVEGVSKDTPVINVGVVTWGGYAGGQLFNEGFKANKESRFFKKYGFLVNFIVLDDFVPSRDAWKADKVDFLWVTVDAYTTEVDALKEYKPKFVFQADWSRGGDAIVARSGIKSANDLKGKKISVAFGTPSHTFLIWTLKAAGMSLDDVKIIQVPSAIDSAKTFKSNAVDAAVVWSPDDEDCVTNVPGSKVLKSTKDASHIIADGFFAKEKYLDKNKKMVQQFIEGWLTGNGEINTSETAKKRAGQILAEGLNQPLDFCIKAINNTRLVTIGDNRNFLNIEGTYQGVKGEDLYTDMSLEYARIGLAPARTPSWKLVSDSSFIRNITLTGAMHAAEGVVTFDAPTEEDVKAPAFSTKRVTVTFDTGSDVVTDEAKVIIEREFGAIAKGFADARVRIEGNTDSTGDPAFNTVLSKRRAKSVANFLASRYKFDKKRFVIVGNGQDKPIADNATVDGRSKNRRTDFELLN